MSGDSISIDALFDRRLDFPDLGASKRLARLVGIDEAKARLTKVLAVLVNPAGPQTWAKKHHNSATAALDYLERRPPLVVLAGDVGTGKTALSETVGDAVARQENIGVTLYPLSLATRGSGKVGEMTLLLSAAFDAVLKAAEKLRRSGGKAAGGIILLVDEADAVTQSREAAQMHHEDRAGVNAFIRGVDRLAEKHLPVAVVLCTNRIGSIDPSVLRRAAEIFEFRRPNEVQRRTVVEAPLTELGFKKHQIERIVELTGPQDERGVGFTFSDLTQRLLPTLILDAYPDRPVTFERAVELLANMKPSPPFRDGAGG
ncbi:MAG TPA: ATP-binding protein [Stellaceae bacterium]|nr:ATP-binding protein [Stellaceae bacterium]